MSTSCKFCGQETRMTATRVCDRCYEVDRRVDAFAQTEAGAARLREALAKHSPSGAFLTPSERVWVAALAASLSDRARLGYHVCGCGHAKGAAEKLCVACADAAWLLARLLRVTGETTS